MGCYYVPSYAVNQFEMWQEDTFNPEILEKEMALCESLGFNVVRIYLHEMLWFQDKEGFKKRIDRMLDIAGKHGVRVTFTFCTNGGGPEKLGRQPELKPFVHGGGHWCQSPHKDIFNNKERWPEFKAYLQDVVKFDPLNYYATNELVLLGAKPASELGKLLRGVPESYLELALYYYHNGFVKEMKDILTASEAARPYPTVEYWLGYLADADGNAELARKWFKKAMYKDIVKNGKASLTTYVQRFWESFDRGPYEQDINAAAYYMQGVGYMAQGRTFKAKRAFRKALKERNDHLWANYYMENL